MKSNLATRLNNFWERLSARYSHHSWWRAEFLLVALALFLALLGSLWNSIENDDIRDQMLEYQQKVKVAYVTDDIQAGQIIEWGKIEYRMIPKASITNNFVNSDSISLVIGKPTQIILKKGDPLFLSAIQGGFQDQKISEKIPLGKRLFTLNIKERGLSYGWLKPNDHVDIIAHMNLPGRGDTTFTLLEDITLVSIGANTLLNSKKTYSGGDISFFVDPEQYEVLAFAENKGSFSLALRNPKDVEKKSDGKGVDMNQFLDNKIVHSASGGGNLKIIEEGKRVITR